MVAVVKHTNDFKQSDVTAHNKALQKMCERWQAIGVNAAPTPEMTLEQFKAEPGFYIKDKGQWRGSFDTEQEARDAKAEWDFERKH